MSAFDKSKGEKVLEPFRQIQGKHGNMSIDLFLQIFFTAARGGCSVLRLVGGDFN